MFYIITILNYYMIVTICIAIFIYWYFITIRVESQKKLRLSLDEYKRKNNYYPDTGNDEQKHSGYNLFYILLIVFKIEKKT